ncbi:amidohydrolase [Paramaledivibacter caminithermalis]|jgi:aminobenzoyl-glutamate utilization protein A|uniref:Aminobenzoyl-glutamate utilization protein A n=1 Tax=Paramaledivibacter caminithermalis (strain DSM 15212 / CIP 107654 / DViRD3) TaxID=1121301 RepID=A0A1M6MSW9_PARC5|nr:amidohydrolase [Paramaledivibacter caminithermalis]SHJ86373.1 aminobenzoyl-glutamate utilization protein A [Paramaledivibacter caminithermalis DSM 15212]
MEKDICKFIEAIKERIIYYRRDFHKYPEVGWTEFRTASKIARRLTELGFDVKLGRDVLKEEDRMGLPSEEELDFHYKRALEQGADKEFIKPLKGGFTGVVGTMDLGDGPVLALRFDIDALKIRENNGENHAPSRLGFLSVNNDIMHACGHDCHAAIGLGVAEVLSNFKEKLDGYGTVKLIFQPAEEGVRGAKAMVGAGILDDVDYVIGGHIGLVAQAGTLVCGVNGFMATTKFDVSFKGLAAHAGGNPNKGKNTMLAACTSVLNLHSIPRHGKGASRINVGTLVSGTDRNIIPDSSIMKVETRGETTEVNDYLRNYAVRIIENASKMHDVDYEIKYMGESICAASSHELINRVKNIGSNLKCFDNIINVFTTSGGSEDFNFMMDKVQKNGGQGVYFAIGTDIKGGHHNSLFDINEEDMLKAVKLFSVLCVDILNNHDKN